jgi:serine phosphatase RsbU (regulator of sigma subunit)
MRPEIFWRKWRRPLIVGLTVLTLAVLAGAGVFTYLAYQRASTELVMERNRQVTYLSAGRLKDEVSKYTETLTSFTRMPEIHGGDARVRRAALAEARYRLAVFDGGVVLLDNFGRVQAAEPERPEILGDDWSGSDFFRELLVSSGPHYSGAVRDGPDGAPVVVISVPILGDNDQFLGVLAGMFRLGESTLSAFYASFVRLRIGQSGNTLLVDGNGQVVYDSGYALVGQAWDLSRFPDFRPGGGVARLQDADGNDVIAAYATVPGTRWTLITEDDWATAVRPLRSSGTALLVLLLLGMVLPAAGVTLLMREQNTAMLERERKEQEARVSSAIRQGLLPRQVPMLPGWSLAVHYQPAQEAMGDFHDFVLLPDGRLMLAVGDVAVAGIPGAQVMSTARATFRGAAKRMLAPAEALEYSNGLMCAVVGEGTIVSCMVAVLDPADGRLSYANAGFLAPLYRRRGGSDALHAPGPPLAAAPDTRYEQWQVTIDPGEFLLLFSDGLPEARGPQGEAFGTARVQTILARQDGDAPSVVDAVLSELRLFTGNRWTQQDDLTVLVVERDHIGSSSARQT